MKKRTSTPIPGAVPTLTKKDFEFSMERLFADGRIRVEEYGRKSDMRRRIATSNPKGDDDE